MAGFWSGLSITLRRLEAIAADSRCLDVDALEPLRALQYRLHSSSELLAGVEPPPGVRSGHQELTEALVDARDTTGEIVEAIEERGREGATEILLEWRGALFRVRLARMRLTVGPTAPVHVPPEVEYSAAVSTAFAIVGATAFMAGAALVLWPLWAAGLALVAGGILAYRP